MARLCAPVFTVLALIAACGGKVLVDSTGGGDQGGGGSNVVLVGPGGSNVVTAGSFGTGTGIAGTVSAGGFYNAGGAYVAGSFNAGGGSFGGGGSFSTYCGPTICPPGTGCCNFQCGICAPIGAGCPAVTCGSAGGFGVGGFSGTGGFAGGGCGPSSMCQARIPGPLPCTNEAACVCGTCSCQASACENDSGCNQIWACALKFNCRNTGCYTPQTCQAVIDQYGVNSPSMNLALQLDQCITGSGCDYCRAAVDAGSACRLPSPPLGVPSCSGQTGPGLCYQQCSDSQMNTFISKCTGNSCTCFYNGLETCSCSTGPQGAQCPGTGCCPAPGWP